MSWLQRKLFELKTGAKVQDYSGVITTPYIIRFKDIYIEVDEMDDGSYDVGWFRTPTMTHISIREFWTARPPKDRGDIRQ